MVLLLLLGTAPSPRPSERRSSSLDPEKGICSFFDHACQSTGRVRAVSKRRQREIEETCQEKTARPVQRVVRPLVDQRVEVVRDAEHDVYAHPPRGRLLPSVVVSVGPLLAARVPAAPLALLPGRGRGGEVLSRHRAVDPVGADQEVDGVGGAVLEVEQHGPPRVTMQAGLRVGGPGDPLPPGAARPQLVQPLQHGPVDVRPEPLAPLHRDGRVP
ncbi:hypothetical protein THAOC_18581, partial [Thalassiosira oceanica]